MMLFLVVFVLGNIWSESVTFLLCYETTKMADLFRDKEVLMLTQLNQPPYSMRPL